jgi:hypothetical protein
VVQTSVNGSQGIHPTPGHVFPTAAVLEHLLVLASGFFNVIDNNSSVPNYNRMAWSIDTMSAEKFFLPDKSLIAKSIVLLR